LRASGKADGEGGDVAKQRPRSGASG
jgi:hypothetical protein